MNHPDRGNSVGKRLAIAVAATAILASACSTAPLSPYTEDTPPLVLIPAPQAGIDD